MNPSSSVVVFATQHMPTGGIESHLREFCLHLTQSGVEVDLVVTNSCMTPETEAFFRQICRRVYLGGQGRSSMRFLWLLWVGITLRFKRYDALYTNGQGESVGLFSKLVAHYGQWVLHHHTAGDKNDQETWGKGYWKSLQHASRVIACSQRNASDMGQVLKREIDVIPCFSREVKPTSMSVQGVDKIRFGYYGRLIPEKGIDILCRLSEDADLQGIEFHLWGEGTAYSSSSFKNFFNVSYHGPFSGREELANVLGSIDGLLLISTHPEGLPISLLEAMSAGLPWLATDRGGIPDIALDPNSTRIIPVSSDYLDVKKAVLSFAKDLKAGRVSKKAQIDLYTKRFSPPVLITQWREVLGISPVA